MILLLCMVIKEKKILGKSPTDGLDETTIIAVTKYSINFTERQKNLLESTLQWKQQ